MFSFLCYSEVATALGLASEPCSENQSWHTLVSFLPAIVSSLPLATWHCPLMLLQHSKEASGGGHPLLRIPDPFQAVGAVVSPCLLNPHKVLEEEGEAHQDCCLAAAML